MSRRSNLPLCLYTYLAAAGVKVTSMTGSIDGRANKIAALQFCLLTQLCTTIWAIWTVKVPLGRSFLACMMFDVLQVRSQERLAKHLPKPASNLHQRAL